MNLAIAKPSENKTDLDEKEISVIHLIQSHPNLNQREIAKTSGISLGLVNVILKRLASKGLLKAKRINSRKLSYVLTPSGFLQVVHSTLREINRNILEVKSIQKKVFESLSKIDLQNFDFYIINGDNELSELVETTLLKLGVESRNINPGIDLENKKHIHIYCEPMPLTNLEDSNYIYLENLIA